MISLTFQKKTNSNACKNENKYFFLMKVRSKISNNHAQNKKKIVQQFLRIKQRREKTKICLWNRQGNEEPIFPTKHWKNQHAKGNKNHPKQRKTQNNMDHSCIPSSEQTKAYTWKWNVYFQFQWIISTEKRKRFQAKKIM